MRILHYSLGFPPYRTGGLTKFCVDLMRQQVKEGHAVSLLWPGEIKLISKETKIRKHELVDGIDSYEVVNPTPVPFDEGIKDFDAFMHQGNAEAYEVLLKHIKPDVIHIHTLMGLHKAFLNITKSQGIRLVFTTHDFFPICPKVTMFRHGRICSCIESCEECGVCNNTALSLKKIQILQSPLYRHLKDNPLVRKLRKRHRDEYLGEGADKENTGLVGRSDDYKKLRGYYQNMLLMMDMIHYNSTVTKSAYERVFNLPNSKVISITHADISDHRKRKNFSDDLLRIRFLGPQGGGKGFFLLKAALDKLWKERQNFCLDVHFEPVESSPYIRTHGRYSYDELEKIFDDTDILVAPSIWYETFGYTVLEALSYGVPVIVSDTLGAKDIIMDDVGIVINDITPKKLYYVIKGLSIRQLQSMNNSIVEHQNIMTIQEMTKQISRECYPEE